MRTIMAKGHSRIPVYADEKNNIIGLLLVRKLDRNQIVDDFRCLLLLNCKTEK